MREYSNKVVKELVVEIFPNRRRHRRSAAFPILTHDGDAWRFRELGVGAFCASHKPFRNSNTCVTSAELGGDDKFCDMMGDLLGYRCGRRYVGN